MNFRKRSINLIKFLGLLFTLQSTYVLSEGEGTEATGNPVESEQSAKSNTSNEQASQSARIAYLEPENKQQIALSKDLAMHEVVWLEVFYPDISESRKVLAIAGPSLIAEKQGAILLLHDKEQHADWPVLIRPVRKELPKVGWYSLSLSLPDETRIVQPERKQAAKLIDQVTLTDNLKKTLELGSRSSKKDEMKDPKADAQSAAPSIEAPSEDKAEVEESASDKESVDINLAANVSKSNFNKLSYEQRALKHVEAAKDYLNQEGYQNIVFLSSGASAKLVLEYIKTHLSEISSPGFAWIMIDPTLSEQDILDIKEWLGESFQAAILDVVTNNQSAPDKLKDLRHMGMVRAGVKEYKQIVLSNQNTAQFDENLIKRIKAWIKLNAPGMKIGGDA